MTDTQPLQRWLASHPDSDENVAAWQAPNGGLAFPDYTATITTFWDAVEALGWPVATGDYIAVLAAWRKANGGTLTIAQVGDLDRHTLFNALRAVQRSERFCDGAWEGAFRDGMLHALARAAITMEGG